MRVRARWTMKVKEVKTGWRREREGGKGGDYITLGASRELRWDLNLHYAQNGKVVDGALIPACNGNPLQITRVT